MHTLHPRLHNVVFEHRAYVKYIFSGGTAAVVDLFLLAMLKELFGAHYLIAASLAFIVAFFVSFFLQKFWTFGHTRMEDLHAQMITYLIIAVTNLGINVGLMYFFVEIAGIWYFFSQIISGALLALMSFFLYRRLVFKTPSFQ